MRRLGAFLAVAVVAAWSLPAAGQAPPREADGRIAGRITRSDGSALGHAWIRIRAGADVRHALADSLGLYGVDVPAGSVELRVEYLGHRPAGLEVSVPPGAQVRVDVRLEEQALALPGFVVRAEPFSVAPAAPRELRPGQPVDPALEMTTLTLDAGLAEVATAAGAARDASGEPPSDGAQVLLMRGSTADLKLLLLDGAPVYTPFHLGGMLESFDTDVLGRAAHYVGAAPARYDGGIDYILDLDTRNPTARGTAFRGALDLLSARASGEWSGERGGILASGRTLHGAGPRLFDGVPSPYGYADGLIRGAWRQGGVEWGFTGFANRESVALGLPDAPFVPEEADWSNRAVSLRAAHGVGPVELAWTAAASRYDAALPLHTDSSVTGITNPVLAQGRTGRLRATVDGRVTLDGGVLRFGLSADRTRATYGSSLRTDAGYARTEVRSGGHAVGGHGEWSGPVSSAVGLRIGGRVDRFAPGGTRTALRGALTWSVSPTAILTLAAGRYHQFTRASDTAVEGALVTALDSVGALDPAFTALQVATGDHVLVGLDQDLTPVVRLGLQGYVKRFADIQGVGADRTSSGVDLRLRAGGADRVGWVGYSLNWTWEDGARGADTDRFLGRHVLSAGFRGPIRGPVGVEARVAFSDGLPLTEVPLDVSEALTGEVPDDLGESGARDLSLPTDADGFLRVDLELFGEWDSPVGTGRVRPYVRLLNALDRRDALFYYFEPWRSPELRPLARRSVLPVLGVAWSF